MRNADELGRYQKMLVTLNDATICVPNIAHEHAVGVFVVHCILFQIYCGDDISNAIRG